MIKNKNPNTQPSNNEMKEVENLYKTNQLDLLEIKLRKLIEIHPQTSILFNILGVILQKKGLFEDAINKGLDVDLFIWDGCTFEHIDDYILGGKNIKLKTSKEILITDTNKTEEIMRVTVNKIVPFISGTLFRFLILHTLFYKTKLKFKKCQTVFNTSFNISIVKQFHN